MKSLLHPITALTGVSVTVAIALRALFFRKAPWLWSLARPVQYPDITPWARPAMNNRDGAEPYALVAVVLLQILLTVGGMALMLGLARRAAPWIRGIVAAMLLAAVVELRQLAPLRAPWPEVAPELGWAIAVVAGALLAALGIRWAMRPNLMRDASPGGGGIPTVVVAALIPICFISTTLPSLLDAPCVLAPAARLAHGFPPSAIYLQYDLLPSLLAVVWSKLGGSAFGFSLVVGAGFYALLLGLFHLARRMFTRGRLAAPMLVAVLIVRFYGVLTNANATPQATPMRLDLWPLLLAATLAWGLEHWAVGALLGGLFLFSRSMGTLYLGSYALALVGDFLARRRVVAAPARAPLGADLRASARRLAPGLTAIGLAAIIARLVFGSFGSDAVKLYREYGIGMLRIQADSFYWWLLPLTGAAGWLVYARRAALPARPAQAGIFAVALLVANSLYFFGRSHEHNLINISASFLFCAFLAIDRAWPAAPGASEDDGARALRWISRAAPWLLVAGCAYFYSGRVVPKIAAAITVAEGGRPLPAAFPGEAMPPINCAEIARAAGDSRVYFFSKNDFWYYDACHLVPQGFVQPLSLALLTKDVAAQINGLLDVGYKIVVPKARDWGAAFAELLPALGAPELIETPQYRLYRRRAGTLRP